MFKYKKKYTLSSADAEFDGTQYKFTVDIPPGVNFNHVFVNSAVIPFSYFLVRAGKNTITVSENSVLRTVTFTVGNGNRESFRRMVKAALNTSSPYVYDITYYNEATTMDDGLYHYSVTGNGSDQPYFIFGDNGMATAMGFAADTSYQFTASALASTNVIKLVPYDILYITSTMVGEDTTEGILQEIATAGATQFGYIYYQCYDSPAECRILSQKNISTFTISILDGNDNVITFGNLPFYISLTMFEKNDIGQMVREYLLAERSDSSVQDLLKILINRFDRLISQ